VRATYNKCKQYGTDYIYDKIAKLFYPKYGRMRSSE